MAQHMSPTAPLIAETGGLNVMIAELMELYQGGQSLVVAFEEGVDLLSCYRVDFGVVGVLCEAVESASHVLERAGADAFVLLVVEVERQGIAKGDGELGGAVMAEKEGDGIL